MPYPENELKTISRHFQIYGEILHAEPLKIGHINETYTATYNQGGLRVRYIHQKINRTVFKNPAGVMKNMMRVTGHLRKNVAFSHAGLDWKQYVEIDPRYYRPAEVDLLIGDYAKAKKKLGWEPQTKFADLAKLMVDADVALLKAHQEGRVKVSQ